MDNITEVRERLHRLANIMSGGRMILSTTASDDLRALLADHARLVEELRKVNSGETVSVRFDLSPAAKEGAVRDQLVAMGWTPPGVAPAIDMDKMVDDIATDHTPFGNYAHEDVIAAIRTALLTAPPGWKLVPVEPTPKMVEAARGHHEGEAYLPFSLYKAMLAAAPEVK